MGCLVLVGCALRRRHRLSSSSIASCTRLGRFRGQALLPQQRQPRRALLSVKPAGRLAENTRLPCFAPLTSTAFIPQIVTYGDLAFSHLEFVGGPRARRGSPRASSCPRVAGGGWARLCSGEREPGRGLRQHVQAAREVQRGAAEPRGRKHREELQSCPEWVADSRIHFCRSSLSLFILWIGLIGFCETTFVSSKH